MTHFYNFGCKDGILPHVTLIVPHEHNDFLDAEQRTAVEQQISNVVAIFTYEDDITLLTRDCFEEWKRNGELDSEDPQTWEEYVKAELFDLIACVLKEVKV